MPKPRKYTSPVDLRMNDPNATPPVEIPKWDELQNDVVTAALDFARTAKAHGWSTRFLTGPLRRNWASLENALFYLLQLNGERVSKQHLRKIGCTNPSSIEALLRCIERNNSNSSESSAKSSGGAKIPSSSSMESPTPQTSSSSDLSAVSADASMTT